MTKEYRKKGLTLEEMQDIIEKPYRDNKFKPVSPQFDDMVVEILIDFYEILCIDYYSDIYNKKKVGDVLEKITGMDIESIWRTNRGFGI